ncbi:ribonuclease H-like domain-containing protein [Tanacetum coccineum]
MGLKDAKTLWAAIKSRFGGNVKIKKMQKNVLKQQFEILLCNLDSEGLDANQKFLRALPSSWNNLISMVPWIHIQNSPELWPFLCMITSSSNEVNTANGVSTASGHNSQGQASSSSYTDDLMFSFFANQSSGPQLDDEDLKQIDHDDLEEMDLKWQVAVAFYQGLSDFYKKTGRKLIFNGKEPVGFDKTKVECFNCHRRGHFARECKASRNQGNRNRDAGYRSRDNTRRTVLVETSDALVVQDNALIVQDGLGYDWSYIAQDEPTEFAFMAYTSNFSGSDTKVQSCSKNCVKTYEKLQKQFDEQRKTLSKANLEIVAYQLGLESIEKQLVVYQKNEVVYEEKIAVLELEVKDKVPSPITGNYIPPLTDLSFTGLDDSVYRPTTNKTSASVSQVETSNTTPSNSNVEMHRVESVRPSGVIIEDWVSDDDGDIFQYEDSQTTVKASFKKIEFTKARNEPVKSDKQAVKPRMVTQSPKVNRIDWNGKMTQKLGLGFRISKEQVNIVRVNGVNTAGQKVVSVVGGNEVTAVKASAGCVWRPKMTDLNNGSKDNSGSWISKRGNPQQALKYKGMFDSGCSRHMTGNKALLTDYQDIDGDLLTKAFDVSRFNFLVASIGKRGRDTKIPQSGGPPIKVGDEAVHKELGDRMERVATTTSSLEA